MNSNGGGSVSTSASSVEEGGSVTITITPNSGYEVASVRGLDDVPANGGTFTVQNVTSNMTISVEFRQVSSSTNPGTDDNDTPNPAS